MDNADSEKIVKMGCFGWGKCVVFVTICVGRKSRQRSFVTQIVQFGTKNV